MWKSLTIPALIGATLLTSSFASAQSVDSMTAEERLSFRAEVRAYLLDNPEVLMEAIGILEDRQAGAEAVADLDLVAANASALFSSPHAWDGGNLEGDIVLVEFLDYRCSYCRRAFEDVEQLIETDGNIRFVIMELPILGEQSVLASRFALSTRTVAGDDAYKAMHDALMVMRSDVNEASLRRIAETFDLDVEAIVAGMNAPEITQIIDDNRALAQRLQISGTPSFVMSDQMLRGYVPFDGMVQIAAQIRMTQ
ncbi:MAG: protein-disulfide isomerase [Paracoccaceae bacterium]|jgi:protein-disulfide isomerase